LSPLNWACWWNWHSFFFLLQVYTQRKTVDNIFLTAAQRYSVLITAKNDTSMNYLMHADMNPDMFDSVPDDLNLSK
jgi:iron transport multicopper oxidase